MIHRMAKSFYLTTTLPYVNADPHIGFALEIVQADIIARYLHAMGDDVFFNTGTDEHGLKIFRKAQEEKKEPQAYVDEYAAKFKKLKEKLNLYPDLHFIRTTDQHHKAAAQELWRQCAAAGDVYKRKYKGLYCVGDEVFLKETELVDGKCPNHPTMTPIEIEEENYFFRLSAYQGKLLEYLKQPGVIIPEWRRQEAIQFVERGLEDFSISRDRSRMNWGVPVPDDDGQTMYVWFDALTNYISTLGWPEDTEGLFKKFWVEGETLQMAGKDQVRFQSIMWQAMLMSAGLPTTKQVIYHGFITSGGQKMSKSVGNVIDPYAIVEEYGADALRYFLARHVHPFEDSDVTMERFKDVYNADLANGLGNLVSRVMKMAVDAGIKARDTDLKLLDDRVRFLEQAQFLSEYRADKAVEAIWSLVETANIFIQTSEPFKTIRTDRAKAETDIKTALYYLIEIAIKLRPFIPDAAKMIEDAIRNSRKPNNLFPRKEVKPMTITVPKKKKKKRSGFDIFPSE